ncbi:hypothetical protein CDD83_11188 [Cordyceps sp. RAO-2017]|nr:hypothetical protein CDD83_11188 [Cordyceps sp. RAO-2017]
MGLTTWERLTTVKPRLPGLGRSWDAWDPDDDPPGAGEDSPYEEVRAAVRNTDGGEMANTLRAWILGLFFVTLGSGLHMFLGLRSPVINLSGIVVQLLAYPIGRLWAKVVPRHVFRWGSVEWSFNRGPFTIKEHVVVTLMTNITIGGAYSTDALVALIGKPFYNHDPGWGFALGLTLTTQLMGIGLTGLFRRVLVWPAAMTWPRQFASTALFYALHDGGGPARLPLRPGWSISRYRWFAAVAGAMFCYHWLPAVLFRGLSVFAFVTWVRPASPVLNQLFGGFSGLSLLPITFDWTYVSAFLGNPLLAPTHAHVNTLVGLVIFIIITTAGIVYSGALYSQYLPMVTAQTYDNTQSYYNVSRVLVRDPYGNPLFSEKKYADYSPVFLPPALALNYGLSFAALTSAFVHIWINHGRDIWLRLRTGRKQKADVHLKLMRRYDEFSDLGYFLLFAGPFGVAWSLCQDRLPLWAFPISIILAVVFIIPVTMVLAVSNIVLGLNVLSPFIAGFIIPGKPFGVMMFNVFSTVLLLQAQTYSGDLKLAHYMKIPPRLTLSCQLVATFWSSVVQVAVMYWTLGHVDGICENTQPNNFTCPNGRAFFSSNVIWGIIGPSRMFGARGMYTQLNLFWVVGAALPVLLYVLTKVFKIRFFSHLQAPVILGAMAWLPPGTPLSYSTWAIVGLVFNYGIRRRFKSWWMAFNFTTAAALDCGLVLCTIVVFLAITLPGIKGPQWWGNTTVFQTLDATNRATLKTVAEGETFGPKEW